MDEALKFIRIHTAAQTPFLTVIWFGNPHVPHEALPSDKAVYSALDEKDQNYYGELHAIDRNIGKLRAALRELKIADNTLVWYTSDNGGAADRNRPVICAAVKGRYGKAVYEYLVSLSGRRASRNRSLVNYPARHLISTRQSSRLPAQRRRSRFNRSTESIYCRCLKGR